jgi:hypothetical protein
VLTADPNGLESADWFKHWVVHGNSLTHPGGVYRHPRLSDLSFCDVARLLTERFATLHGVAVFNTAKSPLHSYENA